MISMLLAASLALAPGSPPPEPVTSDTVPGSVLQGHVLSDRSGMTLPFVLVEVGTGRGYRAVLSNEHGQYRLNGIPPGRHVVRARALGHAPMEVTVDVPPDGLVRLDLSLPVRPVGLPAIHVLGRGDARLAMTGIPEGGAGVTEASPGAELRALETTPGVAELGLADAARDVTRIDPNDPASVLFVRGAGSDLKLVLLDGAPVYAPFHLGGLMEPLSPGVLESSELYMGGAPARYDGGLSYILTLDTRPGARDEPRLNGAADVVAARSRIEGPAGPGSYLVTGRGVHGLGPSTVMSDPLTIGYGDLLGRLDLPVSGRDSLAVTGFFNRQTVDLAAGSPLDGPAYWGNVAASVRYLAHVGDRRLRFVAAGGEFEARLPIGGAASQFAEGRSRRLRLAADVSQNIDGVRVNWGTAYDRHAIDYRARGSTDPNSTVVDRHGLGETVAGFAEATWRLTDAVELRSGLRTSYFVSAEEMRIGPRLTATWEPRPGLTLSASAGRYHQYVRAAAPLAAPDLGEVEENPPARGPLGTEGDVGDAPLSVADATHLVLSARGRPAEGLQAGAQLYYKAFGDPPGGLDLRSTGVDAWIDWQYDGWSAWAGLLIGWTWTPEQLPEGQPAPGTERLLSGGLRAPLPSSVRFTLEVTTSAGLPFTPFPTTTESSSGGQIGDEGGGAHRTAMGPSLALAEASSVVTTPRKSYLRVDAKVHRSWSAELLDTEFRVTPYLKLLNALDRQDALFYHFRRQDELLRRESLGVVPLLPVIGVEWTL